MLPRNSDNIIVTFFHFCVFLWQQNLHPHGSVIGMCMDIHWHFNDIALKCGGYCLQNEVFCYKEHLFLLFICTHHTTLNLNCWHSFINDVAQNWHSNLSLNPYRGSHRTGQIHVSVVSIFICLPQETPFYCCFTFVSLFCVFNHHNRQYESKWLVLDTFQYNIPFTLVPIFLI